MCGIFGLARSAQDPDPARASGVFVELGHLAEQRGRDAAGFALVSRHAAAPMQARIAPLDPSRHRDVRLGRCRIVKNVGAWSGLWQPSHLPALHQASSGLGHTRHASQGAPDALVNAAPLAVGAGLVGTHNGEIDVDDLTARLPFDLPGCRGGTDSEVLFLALDRVRHDLAAVCEVLEAMRGLAALAWVDRTRPHLIYLARAALCPLALARDVGGNLYWGSSPTWFHWLDEWSGGRFSFQVERVGEGTLLVIAAGAGEPVVVAERSFSPVARPGDRDAFPQIWDGLDPAAIAAFQAELRHRTAPVGRKSGGGIRQPLGEQEPAAASHGALATGRLDLH
jgi:asparagine synthetase B (glutamine-hydrolysing)